MKSFAILTALLSLAVAAPTDSSLILRGNKACPAIQPIAPTGQLPPKALSPTFLQIVSKKNPNKAVPAGQKAEVTPGDKCTLTKFDIPAWAKNNTCSLVLMLGGCGSKQSEKGPGNIIFQGNTGVSFPVPGQTTFNNQPVLAPPFNDAPQIKLGNAYRLGGGPCDYKEGQAFASVGGSICSDDTTLKFAQDNGGNGECPIGFHIIIS
ncbi:hypothetical protein COCC4DRAFT_34799 [Bipolaris maydis ATCC 48331]|uniref:Ubiquitin 3 binding protein But2 C-terminal domain-containing protein n=2 Tax=Cochliobolus heterostrophus TaxID=5016 RepID=M2UB61_COCH5|nr:uncharacterized protein COCC4DRAFT_34799 [Bipolaris maydis ATCC 48331]EMD85238.1 hypothetical protein COCHEDRAFT_1024586 [Bipolaris maydis C5]KAH7548686.1 hypothetical protein BM1_10984 [Bipolaris maydis]ENH99481.1 hypothetical protein COCC4DRAFT_34799 [Bipolaris maydis ATCC 48331]KAJ5043199.1 hypothetical protein J3E74DRAFT_392878 [Bipolaris maydis]KAJ5058031.1 hypothetical protein J3E74DRAFT_357091 [Bipolaris maydis]